MSDNIKAQFSIDIQLPKATTRGLMGKQSVRATFRLTKACITAIQIVAVHLGIKQKSLFDHLIEDETSLAFIAEKLEDIDFDDVKRIQKTYVISRRTLALLDKISKKNNASRNAIIEYSARRLLPVIVQERAKHRNRKKILENVKNHYRDGMALLDQIGEILGAEDVMYENLKSLLFGYKQKIDGMGVFVEKGRLIEKFKENDLKQENLKL